MNEMQDSGERQGFGPNSAIRDSDEGKAKMHFLSPYVWPLIHEHYGPYVRKYLLDHDIQHMYALLQDIMRTYGVARLCNWLELGAKKYRAFNWAKGMPMLRCFDSLGRHLAKLQAGEVDEDHLAAAMCNIMFILHYHEEVKAGRLSIQYFDIFDYNDRT